MGFGWDGAAPSEAAPRRREPLSLKPKTSNGSYRERRREFFNSCTKDGFVSHSAARKVSIEVVSV